MGCFGLLKLLKVKINPDQGLILTGTTRYCTQVQGSWSLGLLGGSQPGVRITLGMSSFCNHWDI